MVVVQVGDQHHAQLGPQPVDQRHDPLQMHHAAAQDGVREQGLTAEHDPHSGVAAPDDVVADRRVDVGRAAGHRWV